MGQTSQVWIGPFNDDIDIPSPLSNVSASYSVTPLSMLGVSNLTGGSTHLVNPTRPGSIAGRLDYPSNWWRVFSPESDLIGLVLDFLPKTRRNLNRLRYIAFSDKIGWIRQNLGKISLFSLRSSYNLVGFSQIRLRSDENLMGFAQI